MKNGYCLAILMLLVSSSMVLVASAQDQVALTVYVYDGDFNGTLLSDVSISGQDAADNSFQTVTDSNGAAVVAGQPGTWQFTFTKEGYDTLSINYDVAATDDGSVYLQKTATTPTVENVAMTVYVHEGDLNGTMLSGVQMVGRDAAGNIFQGLTDSDGIVVASGKPGTWQFNFTKEGYEPLSLSYDVTQIDEGAVYLESADLYQGSQSGAGTASSQSYQLLTPISSGTQSSQVDEAERMNQD